MEDDIVPDLHPGIDDHSGIDDAVMADYRAFAYGDIGMDDSVIPYPAILSDYGSGPDGDLPAKLGAAGYTAAPCAVPLIHPALVRNIFQELRYGIVCVLHTDHGRFHLLFRFEIRVYQKDAGFTGVHVLFVLWIGVKTERPGLPVLNFGKGRNPNFGVTFYGAPKYIR
jgi:hypothetical protein